MRAHTNAARIPAQREYPNRYDDGEVLEYQSQHLWNACPDAPEYHPVLVAISKTGRKFAFRPRSQRDVKRFLRRFDRWHYDLQFGFAEQPMEVRRNRGKLRLIFKSVEGRAPKCIMWPVPYSVDLDEVCNSRRSDDKNLFRGILPTRRELRNRRVEVAENDWREIVHRLRAPVRKYLGKCPPGNRGKTCYRIAKTVAEYGATSAEIVRVVMQSDAWQSKTAEQGERWGQGELVRLSKLGKRV